MRYFLVFVFCVYKLAAFAQTDSVRALEEIRAFQKDLNAEYKDPETSPLEPADLKKFKGHKFFPINLAYRVQATLTVTESTPFFGMPTTSQKLSTQRVYGHVEFTLAGKDFKMPVYQSRDLMNTDEYADYLFFPFTDLTNGKTTYMGGRYIDLRIPENGEALVIDFNQAYNPYCAYSHGYSCPIVPAENDIDVEVRAGVTVNGLKGKKLKGKKVGKE